MIVNCWIDKGQEPGKYPTGGPVAKMMDIYQFACSNIDIFAPDIYVKNFYDICNQYAIKNNPLFIPECATHSYTASRLIHTIGNYHAICFSPFGIEDMGEPFTAMESVLFGMDVNDEALSTPQDINIYSNICQRLNEMMIMIGNSEIKNVKSVTFELNDKTILSFDDYDFEISFKAKFLRGQFGSCLIVQSNKNLFYILANNCQIKPKSNKEQLPYLNFINVEQGHLIDNNWKCDCRLNGDEITTVCFHEPVLIKMELYCYH